MRKPQSIEGTWDELSSHADELRGKQLRITVLQGEAVPEDEERDLLVYLLRDYIGACDFGKVDLSVDTSKKYGALLASNNRNVDDDPL